MKFRSVNRLDDRFVRTAFRMEQEIEQFSGLPFVSRIEGRHINAFEQRIVIASVNRQFQARLEQQIAQGDGVDRIVYIKEIRPVWQNHPVESLTDAVEIIENKKVKAVRELLVTEDEFVLFVDPSDEVILGHIRNMVVKMQKTLDFCRRVAALRTPYVITQQRVRMEEIA